MSWRLTDRVLDLLLPDDQERVLLRLARHANDQGGSCRPGIALLMAETGRSERTVQRALLRLQQGGYIRAVAFPTGGRARTTEWQLCTGGWPLRSPAPPVAENPVTGDALLEGNPVMRGTLSGQYPVTAGGVNGQYPVTHDTVSPANPVMRGTLSGENPVTVGTKPRHGGPETPSRWVENPVTGDTPVDQESIIGTGQEPERARARTRPQPHEEIRYGIAPQYVDAHGRPLHGLEKWSQ
jgi:hypothetical protein